MLLIFRFLRGGSESEVLNLEDDSLQEHEHSLTDPGHKPFMIDPGHSHNYKDKYVNILPQPQLDSIRLDNDGNDEPQDMDFNHEDNKKTDNVTTGIYFNNVQTNIRINGISGTDTRIGSETRPKNMKVIYIIKVC